MPAARRLPRACRGTTGPSRCSSAHRPSCAASSGRSGSPSRCRCTSPSRAARSREGVSSAAGEPREQESGLSALVALPRCETGGAHRFRVCNRPLSPGADRHAHDPRQTPGLLRHRRRRPDLRPHPSRRQQERGAPAARRDAADGRAGGAVEHAAHPRRRDDARAARRPRRRGRLDRAERGARVRRGRLDDGARRAPLRAHPRVDPARRPAARPLRPRRGAAAGRRRDRAPARRHAPLRPRGPRRDGRDRSRLQVLGARAACTAPSCSSTRRPSPARRTR